MSSGITANPLNPISQIYLDKIAEGRLKQLEKASALSASDNPADQDKAREIRVRHDYESLKKQIGQYYIERRRFKCLDTQKIK